MIKKRIYKLLPLVLILVCVGAWSNRASLFEIHDAAAAKIGELDAVHSAAQ